MFHSAAGGSHQHSQRPAQPEGNRAGVQLLYPGHSSNLVTKCFIFYHLVYIADHQCVAIWFIVDYCHYAM